MLRGTVQGMVTSHTDQGSQVMEVGDVKFARKLKKWFEAVFALSRDIASLNRAAISPQLAENEW